MLSVDKRFKRNVRVLSRVLLFDLTISEMDLPCKIISYPPLYAMLFFRLGGGFASRPQKRFKITIRLFQNQDMKRNFVLA